MGCVCVVSVLGRKADGMLRIVDKRAIGYYYFSSKQRESVRSKNVDN